MVLVAWGTKEKEEFFNYLTQNLSFWQTFLLLLWSFFACCHKGCNFFQTLIGGLLKESLKQIDFEALILETKDFVFFPKIKYLHYNKKRAILRSKYPRKQQRNQIPKTRSSEQEFLANF
jgi:hypothetical protein